MEDALKNAKTIVVLGASTNRARASNRIVRYLIQEGFKVIPVNPNYELVENLMSYATITEIPTDEQVDIVTIFRNPRFTDETVEDIIQWADSFDNKPMIWTQLGVSTSAAQQTAVEAGFPYVANRCIMVEHSTLS